MELKWTQLLEVSLKDSRDSMARGWTMWLACCFLYLKMRYQSTCASGVPKMEFFCCCDWQHNWWWRGVPWYSDTVSFRGWRGGMKKQIKNMPLQRIISNNERDVSICCMYYDCSYIFLFYFLFSSQYSLCTMYTSSCRRQKPLLIEPIRRKVSTSSGSWWTMRCFHV